MSILEHPRAQALLEDAAVSAATVRGCQARLTAFLKRYLPCFYRKEQHEHARLVLEGKLSGLERKTSEPIAHQAGVHRKPVQNFVGAGAWDDDAVMEELRRHVSEVLGTPEGILALDRSALRSRGKQYVLDVPCNTLIREIGSGASSFERADTWAARQPSSRWQKLTVRDGEKGPLVVRALAVQVQAKDEDGCLGPRETLVVVRTVDRASRSDYALSNAGRHAVLAELVQVRSARHRIEELFETGNGEIGLDHYEVRSWVGWHHHMTLSLLALWFLLLERRRVRKKRQP